MIREGAAVRLIGAACFLFAALALAFAIAAAAGTETGMRGNAAARNSIVDLPVSFEVRNTNTSGVPCPSDGAEYTMRGRLVGPRSALYGKGPRVVTAWLHGFNTGEFLWAPPGAPRLDLAAVLAKLGHVSVTVDQIGYDDSDHPHGLQTCIGAQADIAHQLVRKLRDGDYTIANDRPASFAKVVLAGHDSGATYADIAAYSYGDIDAIIHFNWADQGFSDTAIGGFVEMQPVCASGGQPAEQGPPARRDPAGGPLGYAQFLTDAKIREEQRNTDSELVERLMLMWNRNPCGEYESVPTAANVNTQRLPEIGAPILYGYTEHEFVWTQEGLAEQAELYSGSRDLTTVVIKEAGHFPMFSRVASRFQKTVAEWLRSRSLLSARALTADGCPAANPTIAGGARGDRLHGTERADNLIGYARSDQLSGSGGGDCMKGNRGRDVMRGGAGRDRIEVADGRRDQVRCGRGRDRVRADRLDRLSGCEIVARSG